MVGAGGFDPPTSWSQARRASWLRYTPTNGGPGEFRTRYPLLARQELSRLSYRPGYPPTALVVVTAGAGVEPARQVSLLRSPDATPCCSPNARRPDSTPAPPP